MLTFDFGVDLILVLTMNEKEHECNSEDFQGAEHSSYLVQKTHCVVPFAHVKVSIGLSDEVCVPDHIVLKIVKRI